MNTGLLLQRLTDPDRPQATLRRGASGAVCRNLRQALEALQHMGAGAVCYRYDKDLEKGVLAFQRDSGHDHEDGMFGAGTRTRLVDALVDDGQGSLAERMLDPVRCRTAEGRFAHPDLASGLLRPFDAGYACHNLREALRTLGYRLGDSYTYDEELSEAVRALQTDLRHSTADGCFGPGTRRLLACRLLDVGEEAVLDRMEDPQTPPAPPPPGAACEGNAPFAFLSYAHRDAHVVYEELGPLLTAGQRIWFDDGLTPGTAWESAIRDRVERCRAVLLYVSPAAVDSPHVRREVRTALDRGTPVLPVFLGPQDVSHLTRRLGAAAWANQAVERHRHPPHEAREQIVTALGSVDLAD